MPPISVPDFFGQTEGQMAMGQNPNRSPSEHPNPTTGKNLPKWVVNSPTNQNGIPLHGFDQPPPKNFAQNVAETSVRGAVPDHGGVVLPDLRRMAPGDGDLEPILQPRKTNENQRRLTNTKKKLYKKARETTKNKKHINPRKTNANQ